MYIRDVGEIPIEAQRIAQNEDEAEAFQPPELHYDPIQTTGDVEEIYDIIFQNPLIFRT